MTSLILMHIPEKQALSFKLADSADVTNSVFGETGIILKCRYFRRSYIFNKLNQPKQYSC